MWSAPSFEQGIFRMASNSLLEYIQLALARGSRATTMEMRTPEA